MAIRRCPYCKAIIDESQKYCNNCGTQLLFPEEEPGDEPIKGEKITDADFPGDGSDRLPGGEIDEIRDDVDVDLEADEEREEIDLDKVIDGEVSLSGNTGADIGMIDLREAEPDPEDDADKAESVSIDKPVSVEDGPPPDIRLPESAEPEKAEAPRPGRSLARRRKDEVLKPKPADDAAEKPPKLTPRRDGPGPSKMKDQDTKFQIARLIADFERKRREYTTDLEAPKDEVADEPIVPPTADEIGEPPKPEDLEKEAEALLAGTEGDFATDYEFESEKKDSGTAEPGSLEERLSRLVGGFNVAVESGAETEEEKRSETAHPEFMTGDLPEEASAGKMEEPAPAELPAELPNEHLAFVTQDFEEESKAPPDMEPEAPLSRQDFVPEEQPKAPIPIEPPAPIPFEPPAPAPAPLPPPPAGSADERAALIARILKNRAERLGRADQSRVNKETSDALAALQSSNAAEQAKAREPERPKEPEAPEIVVAPIETGEIRKPEEPAEAEEPEEELPLADREEPGEFLTDAWKTPSEDLPAVPTMGFPEELPKTSTSIPFEAPSAELEPEPAAPPALPTPPVPVLRRAARPAEVKAPEPEAAPPTIMTIEEAMEIEEEPAPAPAAAPAPIPSEKQAEPEEPAKPSVRAPVVHLGFFRRIKATLFDLLVVGAFWAGATGLTAHFLSIPVLDLIASAALPLGLLFVVLLAIYLFMFLLFLGETPGGRLVAPKN